MKLVRCDRLDWLTCVPQVDSWSTACIRLPVYWVKLKRCIVLQNKFRKASKLWRTSYFGQWHQIILSRKNWSPIQWISYRLCHFPYCFGVEPKSFGFTPKKFGIGRERFHFSRTSLKYVRSQVAEQCTSNSCNLRCICTNVPVQNGACLTLVLKRSR